MKKTFIALSLGMAAALAGTSALANTGTINFQGRITAATCPIEVVNPIDGTVGSLVKMGSVDASSFTAVGDERSGASFALRVDDAGGRCTSGNPAVAATTFSGRAGSSPETFGLIPNGARGVEIAIRDKDGTAIGPNIESAEYDLVVNGITDMLFDAYYRRTAAVTAGAASTDVNFTVDIR